MIPSRIIAVIGTAGFPGIAKVAVGIMTVKKLVPVAKGIAVADKSDINACWMILTDCPACDQLYLWKPQTRIKRPYRNG
jgi:hypothetical protein